MADDPRIVTELNPSQASEIVIKLPNKDYTASDIVQILEGYRNEAEASRYAGPNSRDQTWLQNLDLYWNRFDFSKKAPWQAREVMPELPQYVDRFAAAMRTALISSDRFFTVQFNNDADKDIADVIRKIMIVQLRRIARGPGGHPIDFLNVFEELMKLGALMMVGCCVTSKEEDGYMYTCVEPVDPYNIWHDATGRNLYRIRRIECDLHQLDALGLMNDSEGEPLYRMDEIQRCQASAIDTMQRVEREKRTGLGQWMTSNRIPVVLHEYRCTLLDNEGRCIGKNLLCVVANNKFLIRGPEKNPFWHGKDWILTAPIIPTPMSPYGKSYVENFASLARTFNEMTNLILDGVFTSAMKAFVAMPSLLEDPSQIDEGLSPNVVLRAAEGATLPKDVIHSVDLGTLPAQAFDVWQAIKKELQEGAAFNELTLGQLAPNSRTSATEIGTADSNSNSYLKSIASNIETLFLEPLLDLIWKTTIQHLDPNDQELKEAVGEEWWGALVKSRKQFAKMRFTFICRGISSLIQKASKLQGLLQMLQIVGGNQILAQQFFQEISVEKLVSYLYDLFDIEEDRLKMSPREKQIQALAAQVQQNQQMAQEQAGQGPQAPQGGPQPSAGAAGGQANPIAAGVPPTATRQNG